MLPWGKPYPARQRLDSHEVREEGVGQDDGQRPKDQVLEDSGRMQMALVLIKAQ